MFKVSLLITVAIVTMAQVSVPTECMAIAQREGYGSVLQTKNEVIKAKARLVYLRARHPLDKEIRECYKIVNKLVQGILAQ